jgi:hypothetical protein
VVLAAGVGWRNDHPDCCGAVSDMGAKYRNILEPLTPTARKHFLEELNNRLPKKYGLLNTTSIQVIGPTSYHKFTEEDFKNMFAGAESREGARIGAANSLAPRKEAIAERNIELAKAFLALSDVTDLSPTNLKAHIGLTKERLERTAAIAAVTDGLRLLRKK